MKISTNQIFCGLDENNVFIIGFFNSETNDYFMIQDCLNYDEQDIQLGMNSYYIELNDQSNGGYGGIKNFELTRRNLKIDLDELGIKHLKHNSILISFDCTHEEYKSLGESLEKVLKN